MQAETVVKYRCIGDLYWDTVMVYDGGTGQIGWAIDETNHNSRQCCAEFDYIDLKEKR